MRVRLHVAAVFLAMLAPATTRSASAQIAPGVRPPANIAEGVSMAELFGCISAASDRPADGLNMPLDKSLEGVALHEALPASLASKVGKLGSRARILSLATPEGIVWIAFDPEVHACTVTALAADPAGTREKLTSFFESDRSPWRRTADAGNLTTYEWAVRATPRLGTPAVQLRAVLDIPTEAGQQTIVVTRAVKPD